MPVNYKKLSGIIKDNNGGTVLVDLIIINY